MKGNCTKILNPKKTKKIFLNAQKLVARPRRSKLLSPANDPKSVNIAKQIMISGQKEDY
mgnify:CR=1 FL=1